MFLDERVSCWTRGSVTREGDDYSESVQIVPESGPMEEIFFQLKSLDVSDWRVGCRGWWVRLTRFYPVSLGSYWTPRPARLCSCSHLPSWVLCTCTPSIEGARVSSG